MSPLVRVDEEGIGLRSAWPGEVSINKVIVSLTFPGI
jgi:hypothetical protein